MSDSSDGQFDPRSEMGHRPGMMPFGRRPGMNRGHGECPAPSAGSREGLSFQGDKVSVEYIEFVLLGLPKIYQY